MTVLAQSHYSFSKVMEVNQLDDGNVEERTGVAFIEIMGEQDLVYMPFHFKQDHSNVIRLLFDDVDEPLHVPILGEPVDDREYIPVIPMTEEQGKQIVDFVQRNAHAETFVVHCAAGVSRSAGVAKFIHEYFGGNSMTFKIMNPHTLPNVRIASILTKIAQERCSDNADGYT